MVCCTELRRADRSADEMRHFRSVALSLLTHNQSCRVPLRVRARHIGMLSPVEDLDAASRGRNTNAPRIDVILGRTLLGECKRAGDKIVGE